MILKNIHLIIKMKKKRIKKFNKSIDYQSLKINFYVPASRCFGFYKYKEDDILKEENQIISCVPDVFIYDKNSVDFILLITRGAFPLGDSLKKLIDKIKNICNDENENIKNLKLTELIDEYIKNKKEENKKIISCKTGNTPYGATNKPNSKSTNSIYIGKEDFGEENVIINELNSTYYKDIMNMNKTYDCNGDYNMTCILIQLLKNKKPEITPNNEDISKNEDNKNSKDDKLVNEITNKGENNKEENDKKEEDKKEEKNKSEIKEEEKDKSEIKEEEKDKNENKKEEEKDKNEIKGEEKDKSEIKEEEKDKDENKKEEKKDKNEIKGEEKDKNEIKEEEKDKDENKKEEEKDKNEIKEEETNKNEIKEEENDEKNKESEGTTDMVEKDK